MGNHLKSLEDNFNDEASRAFEQLTRVEKDISTLRETIQRLFSIQTSAFRLKQGGKAEKRSRSFKRAVRGFMALNLVLLTPAWADEVWVLTKTNLAEFPSGYVLLDGTNIIFFPKGVLAKKICVEESLYTVVSTNWSTSSEVQNNGVRTITQVGNWITNETLHVEYKGKVYPIAVSQTLGPKVDQRTFDIPTKVTIPALPLRQGK